MSTPGQLEAGVKVSDVMTRDVISIGPDDRLRLAAKLMREHRVGGLPSLQTVMLLA